MGCNRDLVIGVENLPMGESFVLTMDGQTLTNRDFNLWSVSSVSMRHHINFSCGTASDSAY